jgi:hypothetical protein
MKTQLKVGLEEEMRERLEAAAKRSGRGLGEEIRHRLEASLDQDTIDPVTRELVEYVKRLAMMIRLQTNHLNWYEHPGAHAAFRFGVTARLGRIKPDGEALFGPDDVPPPQVRLVIGESPETVGQALEALDHSAPQVNPERLRIMKEKAIRDMLLRFPEHQEQFYGRYPQFRKDEGDKS